MAHKAHGMLPLTKALQNRICLTEVNKVGSINHSAGIEIHLQQKCAKYANLSTAK